MYGLKQGGRAWNKKLDTELKNMNFKQLEADTCVYIKEEGEETVIITVYVDDLLIWTRTEEKLNETKKKLQGKFEIRDLGKVRSILNMKITRNIEKGTLNINQSTYINEILKIYNMLDCKPVSAPLDKYQKITKEHEEQTEETVGSLQYLAQLTRPDIAFATNLMSRFSQNPGTKHWGAIKRILRYLRGTIDLEIQYDKEADNSLTAYSDADWAEDPTDRKSTTGYVTLCQGGAISWTSRKQQTVANSTTEAEYLALSSVVKEVIWIRKLARELESKLSEEPTTIFSDNKSAIKLSNNEGYSQRTKHMDVRHNFLKERVENGEIEICYVPTKYMVADPLIKAVSGRKILDFNYQVGMRRKEKSTIQKNV